MKSEQELLVEQIDYYRARAPEYDDWFYRRDRYDRGARHRDRWNREVEVVRSALRSLPREGSVLELACGTGIWTPVLAERCRSLQVVDSSPEVLARCRSRVDHPDFVATCADIFDWIPDRRYDLVFFSFWLSHVPPGRFVGFWEKVRDALAANGSVFFVDSASHSRYRKADQRPLDEGVWRARRDLRDGREFDIVKIYYEPGELAERLGSLGWSCQVHKTETFFLFGEAARPRPS